MIKLYPMTKLYSIKYWFAEKVKRHPYTMVAIWDMMPRLDILLPHDKSYFGLRHLAKQENGLFLDIGANNGITAAGFRKLNKSYKIISLEANIHLESSLKKLKKRISKFDFRIVAAGDVEGELNLITPFYRNRAIHTHTSSTLEYLKISLQRDFTKRVFDKIEYREHSAKILPVDEMNLTPNIVKIDVEGFDYQVLLGMKKIIKRCRPYFLVEFTPGHMQDFFEFFSSRDYLLYTYDNNSDLFSPFDCTKETENWNANHLQVNIYCIPEEKHGTLFNPSAN